MRCQLCLNFSWHVICKDCLATILKPTLNKRILEDGLVVYSFYKYSEISNLLHTKHTFQGSKIFSLLSKHAIIPFLETFTCKDIFCVPIDDHVRSGYSHTAVIARELRMHLKPIYSSLRATSKVRYSGQKLHVRKNNKRNFKCSIKKGSDVVLIDDIVTSGNTLSEANLTCKENGINVLFAITLADTKE